MTFIVMMRASIRHEEMELFLDKHKDILGDAGLSFSNPSACEC